MYSNSLKSLISYCEKQEFKGYDPYDTLNSWIPFDWVGKWGPSVAIQIQKRNPINIRPIIGIKKGYNPKGMGLFLKAYTLLYKKTGDKKYLEKATWIFNWLKVNYSKGYSGYAWGYNFDWASPRSYLKAYTPSVVVTSFIIGGIYEYYRVTNDTSAKSIIISAADYIRNDIPITELEKGISFSYTHLQKDCCYNASLLAAEILAQANRFEKNEKDILLINKAISFVLSRQNTDGSWFYSYNLENNSERKQIDFHQGFILVSLANLKGMQSEPRADIKEAIEKGLEYYRHNQFTENGRALWRLPKKWPVDIHNQSQGIITFALLSDYNNKYLDFAKRIAEWTITNMQSKKGYFYYRKIPLITNKIAYMRWSQAWMSLALATIINEK